MRLIEKGILKCDCDAVATHLDISGQPECQRCKALNEKAMEFHEKQRLTFLDGPWIISCP